MIARASQKRRHIVLAGGGHAHLAVIESLIQTPLPDCEITLVAPGENLLYSGMIPGVLAGIYEQGHAIIPVAALAERADIQVIDDYLVGCEPEARTIELKRGGSLCYDLLSLAIGGITDTRALANLAAPLLPVRPMDEFLKRWDAEIAPLGQHDKSLIAIIGGGAAGVELAFALEQWASVMPGDMHICLITGTPGLLPGHNFGVQRRARFALGKRNIAIIQADADASADRLALSDGQVIFPNAVIAATGTRAPDWLAAMGIVLSGSGHVAVDATLSSVSHPDILAAGDIVERIDRALPRSGVHAVKAGPVLAHNIRVRMIGGELREYQPREQTLYLLSKGDGTAIASWGSLSLAGRAMWWLKDWIDRGFVGKYRDMAR